MNIITTFFKKLKEKFMHTKNKAPLADAEVRKQMNKTQPEQTRMQNLAKKAKDKPKPKPNEPKPKPRPKPTENPEEN